VVRRERGILSSLKKGTGKIEEDSQPRGSAIVTYFRGGWEIVLGGGVTSHSLAGKGGEFCQKNLAQLFGGKYQAWSSEHRVGAKKGRVILIGKGRGACSERKESSSSI